MKKYLFLSLGLLLLQACSTEVYNNEAYLKATNLQGKKVAILPVEVEYTGRWPKEYTAQKKMAMEEAESVSLQNMLYSEYLYHSKSPRKKQKAVEIINVDQVNSRLHDLGIGARNAWTMNPDSLGRLLGADLVIRARVKKDRIMSDAESLGLGVATSIFNKAADNNNIGGVNNINKTYTINYEVTLSDAGNHTVVSRLTKSSDANWHRSPEEVIKYSAGRIVSRGAVYAQ
jgi:hypothetical protein